MFFKSFHTWTIASTDEQMGIIAYLRALAPKAQGSIDFGGGGHHGDGGMHMPSDGGAGDM